MAYFQPSLVYFLFTSAAKSLKLQRIQSWNAISHNKRPIFRKVLIQITYKRNRFRPTGICLEDAEGSRDKGILRSCPHLNGWRIRRSRLSIWWAYVLTELYGGRRGLGSSLSREYHGQGAVLRIMRPGLTNSTQLSYPFCPECAQVKVHELYATVLSVWRMRWATEQHELYAAVLT